MTSLFVTGIDTDIGKTVVCGVLAKTLLLQHGVSLYTQKPIETGCVDDVSSDLLKHEGIVGKRFNFEELDLHCPYRFKTPASPHLAAERDGRLIDERYLAQQIRELGNRIDHVLVEGAGGLCVPLNDDVLLVDFIAKQRLPIVLVTSPRLGSINHTLLSLALCQAKNIDVRAIIYNHYPNVPVWMLENTRQTLKRYVQENFSTALWLELAKADEMFSLSCDEVDALLG